MTVYEAFSMMIQAGILLVSLLIYIRNNNGKK